MDRQEQTQDIDLSINKDNLYREDSITDLRVGAIRLLLPIKPDGTEDKSRTTKFIGHTQLMSPQGPIPIQAELGANNIEEALEMFPEIMKQNMDEIIKKIKEMQQQEQIKKKDDSRIIVPGM